MLLESIGAGGREGMSAYLYAERYVNSFKKVANEVSLEYCAVGVRASFPVPYLVIPYADADIRKASPSPCVLDDFLLRDGVRLYVHPETVTDFPEMAPLIKGTVDAVPSSSTRTVVPDGKAYALKLHLNRRLSRFIRRLSPESVGHSVEISADIEEAIRTAKAPSSFAYLPESIGISSPALGFGMVVREMTPRPYLYSHSHPSQIGAETENKPRAMVPLFSLYSADMKRPDDAPLFIQIAKERGEDPRRLFLGRIVTPLFENMSWFLEARGMLLEPHGQNVLVELGADHGIERLVHRDFQSMYVHPDIRTWHLLDFPFAKHIMGEECAAEVSLSLVFDNYVGRYVLDPFTQMLQETCGISAEGLARDIRDIFDETFDRGRFPKGYYLMGKKQFEDNNTVVELYDEAPRYRP